MSKPREFWLVPWSVGWECRTKKPDYGDSIHVIEAAPVLKEIAALKAKVKELEALIAATYDAQNG